jgi:hypothetical protein
MGGSAVEESRHLCRVCIDSIQQSRIRGGSGTRLVGTLKITDSHSKKKMKGPTVRSCEPQHAIFNSTLSAVGQHTTSAIKLSC